MDEPHKPSRQRSRARIVGRALVLALHAVWIALVIATPLLGVWLSSSLAAYRNGPIWASALIGLALFPLLPLGWDRLGTWLRNRNNPDRKRLLTFWDRLVLRTLVVNLAFLGGMLALYPETGFRALSTRGDWMLEGHHGPWADAARSRLFAAADALEWLYRSQRDNPYARYADDKDNDVRPEPNPQPTPTGERAPDDDGRGDDDRDNGGQRDGDGDGARDDDSDGARDDGDGARDSDSRDPRRWPMRGRLHPVVAALPAEVETNYAAVARYIADREPDPFLRIKALHDYVADRVAYDAPALARGEYPPQDAETVFRTRLAVCAGYAKLFQAMAESVGDEVVYVVGDGRDRGQRVDGAGHAWNAARIDGLWYLIDVTWDAGSVQDGAFVKGYRTDYLLTPPSIFGLDHLPEKDAWQLRERPISRGEFMRQPMLTPRFYRLGLTLERPRRSQITVGDRVELILDNPKGVHTLALLTDGDGGERARCQVGSPEDTPEDSGRTTRIVCPIPSPGTYQVEIYNARDKYGRYPLTGRIEVNSR